ncbi:uncharacterized protein JCM10292_005498 [Rhodotorula paludigena]|uniref:uncharacterized protein n=1 Tax=Rhodotorula paludigena TaxID=86838 RepID=UPI003170D3CE
MARRYRQRDYEVDIEVLTPWFRWAKWIRARWLVFPALFDWLASVSLLLGPDEHTQVWLPFVSALPALLAVWLLGMYGMRHLKTSESSMCAISCLWMNMMVSTSALVLNSAAFLCTVLATKPVSSSRVGTVVIVVALVVSGVGILLGVPGAEEEMQSENAQAYRATLFSCLLGRRGPYDPLAGGDIEASGVTNDPPCEQNTVRNNTLRPCATEPSADIPPPYNSLAARPPSYSSSALHPRPPSP